MIDTMQLLLSEYDASSANLEVQPSRYNTKTGEMPANFPLYHNGEEWVHGAYAFHRDEHFNVTLKPNVYGRGSHQSTFCLVRFEVPKFAGGNNFHAVDRTGTQDALKRAEKQLKDIGIQTDIETAHISRMDAFKNALVDEPYSCYVPLFGMAKASRMKKRGYENGYLLSNGQQELSFYDKIQKMVHDKLPIDGLPKNALRAELRLLSSRKVRESLGFKNVRGMFAEFDRIQTLYHDTMKQQLFKYCAADSKCMVASQLEAEWRFYQEQYDRNWLDMAFKHRGMKSFLDEIGMDTMLQVLDRLSDDKMKKSRMKAKLEETRFQSVSLDFAPNSSRSIGELYRELEHKLLAA